MARGRNGTPVPTDADAAREHFLVAAEACFDRYGIAKTTMDDIAKMAGVSRPTVYRHFADRDTLILEVVMRRAYSLIDRAQKYIRKQKTFADQLVEGLLFLVNTGRKDPYVRLLVTPEHMDLANTVLGSTTAPVELTLHMWRPILEEAVANGELRADLDFGAIATWLTYVEFVLVGRLDIEPDESAQRTMLRTFVLPAFAPQAAQAVPALARKSRAS
jgi:AcrR family transcriptional regulator